MNIESRAYKLMSIGGGLAIIIRKRDGRARACCLHDLPDILALWQIAESAFDRTMADALTESR